ncbi:MAG: hypothetical protein N3A38_15550, partial [Planctomycetota bacterium]|nr:hypothetical protein [Planctomycetota bacterium]
MNGFEMRYARRPVRIALPEIVSPPASDMAAVRVALHDAPVLGEFRDTEAGGPAEPRTSARMGFDRQGLYLVCECEEPRMKDVRGASRPYDGPAGPDYHADRVELYVDLEHDHVNYAAIWLDVAGNVTVLRCSRTAGELPGDMKASHSLAKTESRPFASVERREAAWIATLSVPWACLRQALNLEATGGPPGPVIGISILRWREPHPPRGSIFGAMVEPGGQVLPTLFADAYPGKAPIQVSEVVFPEQPVWGCNDLTIRVAGAGRSAASLRLEHETWIADEPVFHRGEAGFSPAGRAGDFVGAGHAAAGERPGNAGGRGGDGGGGAGDSCGTSGADGSYGAMGTGGTGGDREGPRHGEGGGRPDGGDGRGDGGDAVEARAHFRLSDRGRWSGYVKPPQRLRLKIRDAASDRIVFSAVYPFAYNAGLIVTEAYGTGEKIPDPAPDDPDFYAKKRAYFLSRIPLFVHATRADGAPSDFSLAAAGGPVFDLMEPGVLRKILDFVTAPFSSDQDRLLAVMWFAHQRTVYRYSSSLSSISGSADPLSAIRIGGGMCGPRAKFFGGLVSHLTCKAAGQPFEAHYLGLDGHVVTAVDVWPGYGDGTDWPGRN